jgi:hypothetical protein
VESSCELGNEISGSIKFWELPNGCTDYGLSCGTRLHRVSYLVLSKITDVSEQQGTIKHETSLK